jgi:hypothetical protein
MERRTVGPHEQDHQRAGSVRLGPGVWVDRAGGLHFSIPELLAFFGEADTPANRAAMEAIALEVFQRECPDAKVVLQDDVEEP